MAMVVVLMVALCLVGLVMTALWIFALVDCVTQEPAEGNERLVWLLILIFFNVIGTLIYFLYRRPQRKAEFGR